MKKLHDYAGELTSLLLLLMGLLMVSTLGLKPVALARLSPPNPGWSYTGSLKWARSGHTAPLWPDGKVVVVGTPEGELYDPSTGTWSVNGTLKVPRQDYTETLLGNGKVLIAGGHDVTYDEPEFTNTAELYDPATGESRFTGNLNVRRFLHTATLLPNGKVLFAGGVTYGNVGGKIEEITTNTAELYDLATGQWSLTGHLGTARSWHAAALLQNGKVLVVGGCLGAYCQDYTASAEVYDPDTGTWSATGDLNTPRILHALTMLPNGNVLVFGGEGRFSPYTLNSAEIYHPDTGRWNTTGSLLNRRKLATATLLCTGQVLVVGGIGITTEVSNSAELYDPVMGAWNTTASLNTARYNHSATLLNNGKALIVGGSNTQDSASHSAELYALTGSGALVTVSAASYRLLGLASEAIAAAFGTGLATTTAAATALPLPTQLAGTTVKVKDNAGMERFAPLFFVSPTQVNYQIPPGTAPGAVTITITGGNGTVSSNTAAIQPIAPGLFAANAGGQGVAAAFALRVKADGSQTYEPIAQFDAAQNKFIVRPLDLGLETDRVYLILFGTGIRHRRSLSSVVASIGGAYTEVSYAGAQPDFTGLDQVNVLVPRSLAGRGEVDVLLTVEAQMANPVRLLIK